MKKTKVAKNITVEDALGFDDLYDDISSNWQLKAERLQKRRWQALKRAYQ